MREKEFQKKKGTIDLRLLLLGSIVVLLVSSKWVSVIVQETINVKYDCLNMFIEKLGKVRYQFTGYYVICLSPLASIILLIFGVSSVYGPHMDFLRPIMWHIGVNVLTVGIQVSGIILYLFGYMKKEFEDFRSLPFAAILLIVWGILACYAMVLSYSVFMDWVSQPFRREITVWDNMEYATMALKGLLWIVSGLTFVVTDLYPRK